jgi:hypothetical protein
MKETKMVLLTATTTRLAHSWTTLMQNNWQTEWSWTLGAVTKRWVLGPYLQSFSQPGEILAARQKLAQEVRDSATINLIKILPPWPVCDSSQQSPSYTLVFHSPKQTGLPHRFKGAYPWSAQDALTPSVTHMTRGWTHHSCVLATPLMCARINIFNSAQKPLVGP